MTDHSTPPLRFAPSPRYWLLALAGIGVGLLFAWDLRRGLSMDLVIFAAMALAGGLWALRQATTDVTVELSAEGQTVSVRRPLAGVERVDFRQILDVGEAGRLVRIVSLLYHPRRADGRMDADAVRTLALPALRDQAAFLEALAPGDGPPAGPP